MNALLVSLEGQSLEISAVKEQYSRIIFCLDKINNGVSIPVDREACASNVNSDRGVRGRDLGTTGSDPRVAVELYRPSPNPFTGATTMAFAVTGFAGQDVHIGVYDVAGRLVRNLVNGHYAPGRYSASWDGRSDEGMTVTRGVYFVRAVVGGQRVTDASRVLYLR